jgi:O-antigen/teichoic acid export membrane protein
VATLLKRTLVLSFSRFANQAIVLLSPMLLVRILSVGEYGMYREFLLYAGLIAPVVTLGIRQSLIYFIPKHPELERVWITQTILYTLAAGNIAIVAIYLGGDLIRSNTSFDFVTELQLYILFFVNLAYLESYWLGKKRTDYVLYFSAARLIIRLIVVVSIAYVTRDTRAVIIGLIVLECIKCFLILAYTISRRLFSSQITWSNLGLQMSYFLPLGLGGVVELFNGRAGMLFTSSTLGAEALAYYTIGALAVQVVNLLRGAIADVVFPEIVELRRAVPKDSLPLWKRATVWYCVLLFPTAIVFSYYADAVVTVLFTAEYAAAIPIFALYALMLYLFCFDFHLPLRVQNANRYFLTGNIIALAVNVVLLYPLYLAFGLLGPVAALLASRLVFTVYLGYRTVKLYQVGWGELVRWPDVGKVLVAAVVCLPLLVIGRYLVPDLLLRSIVFGSLYVGAYLFALRTLGVWDAYSTMRRLVRREATP